MIAIRKAMALAAGLGTRMRPITNERPKALVEVGGKTLLDWALDRFAAGGVEHCVVNVHHFADMMEAHLDARTGAPRITVSDERGEVLETGGGVVKALPELGSDPVFIANIDAIWEEEGAASLDGLRAAWDGARMDALLLLAPMDATLGFDGPGDAFLDPGGQVRFRGEADRAPYAYAGVQILHPRALAGRSVSRFSMMEVWRELAAKGRLHGATLPAFWMHVGDPGALAEAEARLARPTR
ncbi:nucleotidyltransferase family protein [Maricaulis maris]|uniref:MurNAc alpha-1-phosphate uridylyltransferase n=1 Tax=Maricaulis maris TaxID=74318 RepID=A0A495D2M4_9PROT|nr:nucleotidyltransferase family protein [Maricaulis maris]RKQ96017.1 MurNAc alpha-1-phosphate uridylyltransferase [Maricaulis maris]